MASLGLIRGIYPSGHGILEGTEVLWRDLVPDLFFQTFAITVLNKPTS